MITDPHKSAIIDERQRRFAEVLARKGEEGSRPTDKELTLQRKIEDALDVLMLHANVANQQRCEAAMLQLFQTELLPALRASDA